jgi:hypothetical protein
MDRIGLGRMENKIILAAIAIVLILPGVLTGCINIDSQSGISAFSVASVVKTAKTRTLHVTINDGKTVPVSDKLASETKTEYNSAVPVDVNNGDEHEDLAPPLPEENSLYYFFNPECPCLRKSR